tara:strand:- start:2389 stop:2922 length:534 start_codon:yes stop_codon:yes gene_type:complete
MNKWLIIGNGPSIKDINPMLIRDNYGFDGIIACNHAFQQWPELNYYVMADERNVLYATNNATPDQLLRCRTKQPWANRYKMEQVPNLNKPEISGSMAIRLANSLGANWILCLGFDYHVNQDEASKDKGYRDVPWEKRHPRDGGMWIQAIDQACQDCSGSVRFLRNLNSLNTSTRNRL